MDAPYQAAADVHVLPSSPLFPGMGVFTVNAFVLLAGEPVLVDTGLAADGDQFVDALSSVLDPAALRWVWLTHDDADHTGNIQRIMELAPHARLVTPAFCALRMASWWPVPLDRVHAIRPGDELHVGDRTLTARQPPLYDNPTSTGVLDGATGALFSVDAFGALLPEATQELDEVPEEALTEGMLGWATSDSPWTHIVDQERYSGVLEEVRRLEPSHIFSSHLPAAGGHRLEQFLQVLEDVPDAEPLEGPDYEAFKELAAAMAEMQDDQTPMLPT